jgi:hypothetical protein
MFFPILIIPCFALLISALSLYFSVRSWREANRPLVTARVSSLGMGGNVSVALSLIVENTGNRPAKSIRLKVNEEILSQQLTQDTSNSLTRQIRDCFSEEGIIPVLANGKHVSNSFGLISEDCSTWRSDGRFEIEISYEDLDGRQFKSTVPLAVKEDQGFASGFWVRSPS